MKKNILISLAGMTLLSVGLTQSVQTNQTVQAATVKVGKKSRLTHNAYVYNAKGKKISISSLERGTKFKILSIKKIHGKKYARIGKNEYIKLTNFTKKTSKSNGETALVEHNSYVYNAKGRRVNKKTFKHGKIVDFLGVKKIHGHKYIQIGKNHSSE